MNDLHSRHPAHDDAADAPPMPSEAELMALMDASDAEVAADRAVPLAPVLARMRATEDRIRGERAEENQSTHLPA